MTAPYVLSAEAVKAFRDISRTTAARWGTDQAAKYLSILITGFEDIAANPRRGRLYASERTGEFRTRRFGRHHVVYIIEPNAPVIIAGLFHERMNLPARLALLTAKPRR
ncbi:type II toxin-antitoxin system RelE/ParE family toxin [Asticcacaulis sp.]|uniref:type II toxin-antitoxin system RelE/ParE family toxin n=1 Tax=Asticcacaulis sp. TaxID=1872648 RepID=UPI00391C6D08